MAIKIEQAEGAAPQEELEFFIKGEISQTFALLHTKPVNANNVQSRCSLLPPFCVSGNLSLEKSKRRKPCEWLLDQSWEDLVKLAELFPEQFGSLPDDVENNSTDWESVSDHSDRKHLNLLPDVWSVDPSVFLSSVV